MCHIERSKEKKGGRGSKRERKWNQVGSLVFSGFSPRSVMDGTCGVECMRKEIHHRLGGVRSTVASKSALRSAGTLLSRVRAPPSAPWPDGGSESRRSFCCGLAIYSRPIN
ncbi:hypothetical protein PoB_005228600 [Plakobranchus ocellatus]|uniref:Uncharacterized protein n=1 Tax=Plakobranchus ocellatus TaxID=259542 RepID=A0AAV4BR96_9GAST|nr:hypothetical protein PoB_005228600 [Plakobranchus ocellatus]